MGKELVLRVGAGKMGIKNIFSHQKEVVSRIFGKREEGAKSAFLKCRCGIFFEFLEISLSFLELFRY